MTNSDQKTARFRSATEFPRQVDHLSPLEVSALYGEMRECLIFTNRSRAQLIRRNEEHKQSTLRLRTDVERLQTLVSQLQQEKSALAEKDRFIISELEREIGSMTGRLDQLSAAFDTVADLENPAQGQWSFLAMPGRFFSFLRAVKAVVLWWREERNEDEEAFEQSHPSTHAQLPGNSEVEDDRRENPQMYTDPASQGRSLLDR